MIAGKPWGASFSASFVWLSGGVWPIAKGVFDSAAKISKLTEIVMRG